MLNILIQLLNDNHLYLNKELRRIPDSSCSNVTIEVLDFDLIKDTFYRNLGLPENVKFKSADALKIIPAQNKIIFIEMKKFDKSLGLKIDEFIKERIECFQNKIIDSVLILLGICGLYKINNDFYKYFYNTSELTIKSVFLSNISSKDYVTANIASLPSYKISITKRIDENISFFTCETFQSAIRNNTI
jgi:hypothetical protein